MDGIAFDSLGFSKRLIQAGFSQEQAEALANLTTELEAERRNALATKADIMAIKDAMATKADMKDAEIRLLKWQIGIGAALVAVMAKGFGWLGF